jgi:transposase InsO family protein
MKAKQQGWYLIPHIVLSKTKYDRWRKLTNTLHLSKKAKRRLEWIIYYETKAQKNTTLTCRHFGISRSLWYYWKKRFNEEDLSSLEDIPPIAQKTRQKEYTPLQYERVLCIRKKYIRYGKEKILRLYQKEYPEDESITSWKVQCIIEISGLYYHKKNQEKTNRKRKRAKERKRITELKKKPKLGHLLCLDTIVRYYSGKKRYILTAIDKHAKIAYARMYKNHSSLSSSDFLKRLHYLLDGNIQNLQTDNGSEFMKYFEIACSELTIPHYFSRVRTPKDNPDNERFNRTLQEEFIQLGNMTYDTKKFNHRLTEWLIEYNFHRPHQSLDYMTPMGFTQKYSKVSKRYSSHTISLQSIFFIV